MKRIIPATMVSQHPDHAGKPYWHTEEFISTSNEVKECYLSFSELGVSEYKWDWEGKHVDEGVMERLLGEHYEFFKQKKIGLDKFLTFRLPNPKVETEFRLGRAFMGLISSAQLAKQVGLYSPPLFEVILPMTQSAEEMIDIQEAFSEMTHLKHKLYNFGNGTLKHIEVIPLFEQVETIIESDKILINYLTLHKKYFGFTPEYIRPYIARSDPALNSGLVSTILALKISLSRYKKFYDNQGVELYPIIGTGSLPFRGGLNPDTIDDFLSEYKGIRTALLQSAFRYDFEIEKVKTAIEKLELELPKGHAVTIPAKDQQLLRKAISVFEESYRATIAGISPLINTVSAVLPKRRERVLHVGLFGYSRGVGGVRLPRAIGFTGALYSVGVPPELIGTGRGIKKTKKLGLLPEVENNYLNLKKDVMQAGRFLNKEVLSDLSKIEPTWNLISEDIAEIEKFLGEELAPVTNEEKLHQKHTSTIYRKIKKGKIPNEEIIQAAVLRKSMG